ncbi:MAG: hypothetical protein ACRYF5_18675 [Janthinobacterium lividum]
MTLDDILNTAKKMTEAKTLADLLKSKTDMEPTSDLHLQQERSDYFFAGAIAFQILLGRLQEKNGMEFVEGMTSLKAEIASEIRTIADRKNNDLRAASAGTKTEPEKKDADNIQRAILYANGHREELHEAPSMVSIALNIGSASMVCQKLKDGSMLFYCESNTAEKHGINAAASALSKGHCKCPADHRVYGTAVHLRAGDIER